MPIEPFKIEIDGDVYELKVRSYRSPTGIGIELDLGDLRQQFRRWLEELEA